MGFLNKIQPHHSLLQSVTLKQNQVDVSVKTQKKIDMKIAAHITAAKNGTAADIMPLTDALKHLQSLGTKTGAVRKMADQIKAGIDKFKANEKRSEVSHRASPAANDPKAESNKNVIVAQRHAARRDSAFQRQHAAMEMARDEILKSGVSWESAAQKHDVKDPDILKTLRDYGELRAARKEVQQGKDWEHVVQSRDIKDRDIVHTLKTEAAKCKKRDAERLEVRTNFARVYQTNHGCKAINAAARALFGEHTRQASATPLSGDKVISEYKENIGENIFEKGNADLKIELKTWCKSADENILAAADAFYTPSDSQRLTWRGATVTRNGLEQIMLGKTFKAGQFFSTSQKQSVAESFCNAGKGEVSVLFEVRGNSSNRVAVGRGLAFGGHGAGGEAEQLYSPRACFKVESVTKPRESSAPYVIRLSEVSERKNAMALPY